MEQSRTFLRNFASLTAANFFTRIVAGVVGVLVMRYLGDARYGAFSTALAFATVFLIFAETGVGPRFLYDRSGDKSNIDEHFGAVLFLIAGPYSVSLLVTMTVAFFFSRSSPDVYTPQVLLLIAIVSVSAILRELADTCERVMTVHLKLYISAVLRAYRFLFIGAGGILVIVAKLGTVAWALVTLFAMASAFVFTFIVALRFVRPRLVWKTLWPYLASSYIFGVGAIFFAIYDKVDQVMLSRLLPGESAWARIGVYAAAYTLITFTHAIPAAFVASMEPVVFAARDDFERLARLANRSMRAVALIGIPLNVATVVLATEIQVFLLPKFGSALAGVLLVLSWFGLLRFISFPSGMFMAASGLQKTRVVIQGIAVGVNILVNFLLIRRYGIYGAAWATVITEAFIFALYNGFLIRRLPGYRSVLVIGKPIAATAVMVLSIVAARYALTQLGHYGRFEWLAFVAPAAALYFLILWLWDFFMPEELDMARHVVGRLAFWRSQK